MLWGQWYSTLILGYILKCHQKILSMNCCFMKYIVSHHWRLFISPIVIHDITVLCVDILLGVYIFKKACTVLNWLVSVNLAVDMTVLPQNLKFKCRLNKLDLVHSAFERQSLSLIINSITSLENLFNFQDVKTLLWI